MVTHSSILAWEIPWTEEPSGLQSFIVPFACYNVPLVSLIFLKRSLIFPILLFSSISLHCSLRKVYLSLLFFGTLHSDGYIFPFLLCLLLLFFSQLFVRPPLTPFCFFMFLLFGDGLDHCLLYSVMNLLHSSSGTLFIRSNPLNLFVAYTVCNP